MSVTRWAVVLLALSAALAWADVPPPDVSGCNGQAPGAACVRDDGSSGACVKDTCTRNDYSQGPPPTPVQYECLRCAAGATPDAGAPPAEAPKKSGCAAAAELSVAAAGAWLLLRRRRATP